MRRVAWYQKRAQLNLAYRRPYKVQKAGGMQKCTLPNIEITRRHPVILLRKWGKENGGHIMIQNIKMAAILLYKTTNGWKKPINNPLLTLAILVYPPKKILRRFRPKLGNPGYFCSESGSWALESGLQFKASWIAPAIGIWNQVPETENPESIKHFSHAETFFVAWIVHSCWPRGWK